MIRGGLGVIRTVFNFCLNITGHYLICQTGSKLEAVTPQYGKAAGRGARRSLNSPENPRFRRRCSQAHRYRCRHHVPFHHVRWLVWPALSPRWHVRHDLTPLGTSGVLILAALPIALVFLFIRASSGSCFLHLLGLRQW